MLFEICISLVTPLLALAGHSAEGRGEDTEWSGDDDVREAQQGAGAEDGGLGGTERMGTTAVGGRPSADKEAGRVGGARQVGLRRADAGRERRRIRGIFQ